MKKLLIIALLIVGCDNSTEYEEPSVVEYPNQTGNSWTYVCNETIGDYYYKSGYSFIKIIDNFPINYIIDYCGEETIIFEKTDSISIFEYESPSPLVIEESDDPAPLPVNIVIDSVKVDTLIYSITEDSIAYCLSASSLNQNSSDMPTLVLPVYHFHMSKPPNIQYPLFVGKSWEENSGFGIINYEVIGAQNVSTEIKTHNCYLIKKSGLASTEYYYYVSSEGLIKSYMFAEVAGTVIPINDYEIPYDDILTISTSSECILLDRVTNPL